MSGHIVKTDIPHPMLEEQLRRYPLDLRVRCPFCNAGPLQPCVMSWTHPSRTTEAQKLQPKQPSINDLPNSIKKDLMDYCEANNIDPCTLHKLSTEELFNYWCNWKGFKGWGPMFISVLNSMREVKG